MTTLIISASHRKHSNSCKMATYLQKNYFAKTSDTQTELLDLSNYPNLLDHYYDESIQRPDLIKEKDIVLNKLYACDAVVFVVPEWGGMIPPALVNLLLLCANGSASGLPLGHKPAFAIGLSTSAGGSNPISLLKAYAAKNTHLTWLPLHAIVHNVDDFLTSSWTPKNDDRISQVQSRINTGLKALDIYSDTLRPVRDHLVTLSKIHPFGQ